MDPLDEALGLLAHTHSPIGFANHAPMAAEALAFLGYEREIPRWARRYARRVLVERPRGTAFPNGTDLAAMIGLPERNADWVAWFDARIEREGWRSVLADWLPRLVPGLSCFAAHALIRTAHAVRSLEGRSSRERLHELAEGLGDWASHYSELPGAPGASPHPLRPSRAIHSVEPVPAADQGGFGGTIVSRLASLAGVDSFPPVIDLIDAEGDVESLVADLTTTAARLYLANVERGRGLEFIHTVTGSSALRPLLPHLDDGNQSLALRYAWQLVAGMYVAAGSEREPDFTPRKPVPAAPALIERAVATADDHAIKFAQACVIESSHTGDPIFLRALADAVERGETLQSRLRALATHAGQQGITTLARLARSTSFTTRAGTS